MTTPMFNRNELISIAMIAGNRAADVRQNVLLVGRETEALKFADLSYAKDLSDLADKCHALLEDKSIWLTHSVLVEYDGCCNEPERFSGSHEQCLAWMRKHRAPKGCDWALKSNETGRLCSYML